MRIAWVAILLTAITFVGNEPEPTQACTGRVLRFEDAVRMSHGAIYAGRITRSEKAETFWTDVTLDIDLVVRGAAKARVLRAQAGAACDPILVGEWGYMIRDVRDPEYPRLKYNDVFFQIGRSQARNVLRVAGLPETSTEVARAAVAPVGLWLAVILTSSMAFVVAYRGLRRGSRSPATRG